VGGVFSELRAASIVFAVTILMAMLTEEENSAESTPNAV
jgi:hypothetical protein